MQYVTLSFATFGEKIGMLKKILFIISLLSISIAAAATPERAESTPRKKVGLVLSGGGAKGVAHVGVIKVLEEADIPIDYIAGTSMGAIVGGLYAIGYTTSELDSMFRHQNWINLLSDKVSRQDKPFTERESSDAYLISIPLTKDKRLKMPSGIVQGENVFNMLSELTIGFHDSISFDTLPIPFACVAYDMVEGKDVIFRSGDLPLAIRASMSIPGAFEPVKTQDMVLVDGGISNNFPVDVVRDMGAQIIIGVDLAQGLKDKDELNTVMGIVDQITTFLGRENYQRNREDVDLYLHPDVVPYTAASFNAAAIDTLLKRGETIARQHWDDIVALKEKIGIGTDFQTSPIRIAHVLESDSLKIGAIEIQGISPLEQKSVRRNLEIRPNTTITKGSLTNAVGILRGSGVFSNVSYKLTGRPPYQLTLYAQEKSRNALNLGFRFDTEEMAALLINATFATPGLRGGAFQLTGRLSDNPYVELGYSFGRTFIGQLGLSYRFKYNDYNVYNDGSKQYNVTYGQHTIDLSLIGLRYLSFKATLGAQFEYYDYNRFSYADERSRIDVKPGYYVNYYISGLYETLDNAYYPRKGWRVGAKYTLHTGNFSKHRDGAPFSSVYAGALFAHSVSSRVSFIPALYGRFLIGNNATYPYFNSMGGEVAGRYMAQQLPFVGINHLELFADNLVMAKLDLRVRLWKKHFVSAKANYATDSDRFVDLFAAKHYWGAGIGYSYDSFIGPIEILFSTGNVNRFGVYFTLGRYF